MVSSQPTVPWYDRPAREFPIKRWLGTRYPFYIPPSLFARYASASSTPQQTGRRVFPAKRWAIQQRQRVGGA